MPNPFVPTTCFAWSVPVAIPVPTVHHGHVTLQTTVQKYQQPPAAQDYMTAVDDYLSCQNGTVKQKAAVVTVHSDVAASWATQAAQILVGLGAPPESTQSFRQRCHPDTGEF